MLGLKGTVFDTHHDARPHQMLNAGCAVSMSIKWDMLTHFGYGNPSCERSCDAERACEDSVSHGTGPCSARR